MPDAPAGGGSKDSFGFLTRKLGPAPLWLWAALAVGAYYLYTKYKGGSSSAASGAAAIDPATGVTYAQELNDAETAIAALQAQVNQQGQGQTAPPAPDVTNVTVNDTGDAGTPAPASGPAPAPAPGPAPAPKPAPAPGGTAKIPAVAGQRAAFAISAVEAAGFETHTNPLRNPADEYVATGTSPSGSAPRGSTVVISVRQVASTTKAKAAAKPKRPAATTLKSVPAVKKKAA